MLTNPAKIIYSRLREICILTAIVIIVGSQAHVAQADILTMDVNSDYEISMNDKGWMTWVTPRMDIMLHNGRQILNLRSAPGDEWGPTGYNAPGKINNNGWVVWHANDSNPEIFLYNGRETIQLTHTSGWEWQARIADNNWVTWTEESPGSSGRFNVLLYDGKETKKLNNTAFDAFKPQINDRGQVAFLALDRVNSKTDVALYENGVIRKLSKTPMVFSVDISPEINNEGWVAWVGATGSAMYGRGVFLYNGVETIQLNDDQVNGVKINDDGWVTWFDSAGGIFLNNRLESKVLPATSSDNRNPQINDEGWVAWEGHDGHDVEIFLYDGTETIQVTNNEHDDRLPELNNIGWDTTLRGQLSPAAVNKFSALAFKSDGGWGDDARPLAYMRVPYTSTNISKMPTFKISWGAYDPSPLAWHSRYGGKNAVLSTGNSGIASYSVFVRPATSSTWTTYRNKTTSTYAWFKGKPGETYYFRITAQDKAGNASRTGTYKTIVPSNEGSYYKRRGFNGYREGPNSPDYLKSTRFSSRKGHFLVYKLVKTNAIGLITSKGPNRGKAKIYVDGKYVKTVDAYSSTIKPRQRIFYKGFADKRTHYLKIENLGTPGRSRFYVDGVMAGR